LFQVKAKSSNVEEDKMEIDAEQSSGEAAVLEEKEQAPGVFRG
jgi:hypothetical protein